MKYQNLCFLGKIRKNNIIYLSSAELAKRVVMDKVKTFIVRYSKIIKITNNYHRENNRNYRDYRKFLRFYR